MNITRPLAMTDGEISSSYRQAKNQRAQLRILAQLNDCPIDRIREVLIRHGYAAQKPKPRKAGMRREWTAAALAILAEE